MYIKAHVELKQSMLGVILLAIVGWACSVFLCGTACILCQRLDAANRPVHNPVQPPATDVAKPPVVVLGPMYECCIAAKDEIV